MGPDRIRTAGFLTDNCSGMDLTQVPKHCGKILLLASCFWKFIFKRLHSLGVDLDTKMIAESDSNFYAQINWDFHQRMNERASEYRKAENRQFLWEVKNNIEKKKWDGGMKLRRRVNYLPVFWRQAERTGSSLLALDLGWVKHITLRPWNPNHPSLCWAPSHHWTHSTLFPFCISLFVAKKNLKYMVSCFYVFLLTAEFGHSANTMCPVLVNHKH